MSGDQKVPAKADGLHIERQGQELSVFDTRNQRAHTLDEVSAAVFEACNGERSTADAVNAVAEWVKDDVETEVVDRTIIDLTQAELVIHLDG